jgi:hypothetical protein
MMKDWTGLTWVVVVVVVVVVDESGCLIGGIVVF